MRGRTSSVRWVIGSRSSGIAQREGTRPAGDAGEHTLRHTTATHLLRAGVDINTIRAWLGHVSLATTNVYAEVDLQMKAEALSACEVKDPGTTQKPWREDAGLMKFLASL